MIFCIQEKDPFDDFIKSSKDPIVHIGTPVWEFYHDALESITNDNQEVYWVNAIWEKTTQPIQFKNSKCRTLMKVSFVGKLSDLQRKEHLGEFVK